MSGQPCALLLREGGHSSTHLPWPLTSPCLCSLSVCGDGGAFEQQVAGAVLDLMGDEAQNLTRGRQQLKW